ncbi:MAG: biotin/lipoyl-containing protein, partial [Thermovirgaceae bacterium]
MEQVTMPKLGLTMTEGTVSQWKASPGDRVKKDEVLLVVATDKLTYEVVSPIDGAVLEILVNEGETVPVGTVLAVLGAEGEKAPA